jgi:hypothetical protein
VIGKICQEFAPDFAMKSMKRSASAKSPDGNEVIWHKMPECRAINCKGRRRKPLTLRLISNG